MSHRILTENDVTPVFYSTAALQKLISASQSAIYRLIEHAEMPKPVKIKGRLCWPREAMDQWIAEHEAEFKKNLAARAPAAPSAKPKYPPLEKY